MKLGEIIKEYRSNHSLSMGDFAKLTNLSKAYISMLEKNINSSTGKPIIPSIHTLRDCAKAMGITLDDLMSKLDPDQLINVTDIKYSDDKNTNPAPAFEKVLNLHKIFDEEFVSMYTKLEPAQRKQAAAFLKFLLSSDENVTDKK